MAELIVVGFKKDMHRASRVIIVSCAATSYTVESQSCSNASIASLAKSLVRNRSSFSA